MLLLCMIHQIAFVCKPFLTECTRKWFNASVLFIFYPPTKHDIRLEAQQDEPQAQNTGNSFGQNKESPEGFLLSAVAGVAGVVSVAGAAAYACRKRRRSSPQRSDVKNKT